MEPQLTKSRHAKQKGKLFCLNNLSPLQTYLVVNRNLLQQIWYWHCHVWKGWVSTKNVSSNIYYIFFQLFPQFFLSQFNYLCPNLPSKSCGLQECYNLTKRNNLKKNNRGPYWVCVALTPDICLIMTPRLILIWWWDINW